MQPDVQTRATVRRIAAKEITLFFALPIAYLFLATFAAVTLFIFFWGESFFARNIADVRPLFEWLPVLLIFLCAALTMRLWSEERRSGTLEYVLTQAVPLSHFVVGKFLGCLFLLTVALAITLPLPVTVALIGHLDWGPVLAGYLATLLMGAAYLSIGLFVSARSDNQIVSLIGACAVGGLFYLIGSPSITDFVGNRAGEWLHLFGMGSRFDAITRGVIDLRDLYYYISIVLAFLALNTLVLEKERWAAGGGGQHHHKQWQTITALLVANALGANLWLGQLNGLRVDMTQGNQYSISDATKSYLRQLQEPLLIRGYFSAKTHPLLAPLVPQLRDLISEFAVAGHGKVRIEYVDPQSKPELEEEANQKYGIEPVPFQVADRYQSSIVSSYFNVLVQYGDQFEVLGFRDLIEVRSRSESDIDVELRNPEYDLTRSIKKVLNAYQAGGNLFDTVKADLVLTAYVSDDKRLPEQLVAFKKVIGEAITDTQKQAHGRLSINTVDPEADNGRVAKQIAEDYGFKPMAISLFSDRNFYFYLTLSDGNQVAQIPLGDLSMAGFKRNLEAGIKRFASGLTKTVALVTPKPDYSAYGGYGASGRRFSHLEKILSTDLNVEHEDLSDGTVSGTADILVLAAPGDLDNKQLFAIDQFLMKGGTVMAATSPYSASLAHRTLSLQRHHSGIEKWLAHNGLTIADKLVLDPQNAAFPIPVTRNISGFSLQEIRMLDYPYFIDVRGSSLNEKSPITSELPQATVAWASPIEVDAEARKQRIVTELLRSSDHAWLSDSTDIMPKIDAHGLSAFAPEGEQAGQLLGVIMEGRFESYFADEPSPLLQEKDSAQKNNETTEENVQGVVADSNGKKENPVDDSVGTEADADSDKETPVRIGSVIARSPESAHIILFSSNDFLRDQILDLIGSGRQSEYLNTLQLAANAVDWSLEDAGLLAIRSRGHFNRTLRPMDRAHQIFWEYLNYGLAILSLVTISLLVRKMRRGHHRHYVHLLAQ